MISDDTRVRVRSRASLRSDIIMINNAHRIIMILLRDDTFGMQASEQTLEAETLSDNNKFL